MWPWRYQFILLTALAAQNTVLVLLMKHVLTRNTNTPTTLNVIAVEVVKLTLCFLIELPRHNYRPKSVMQSINGDPHRLRNALPAALYAIQNNLCLQAMRRMGPVEYQVVYQSKVLVTAVVAWAWTGRRLRAVQWISLVILCLGVSLVVLDGTTTTSYGNSNSNHSVAVGVVCLLLASLTSATCGVYLEALTKQANQRRRSVALQSAGLAIYSLPVAILLHLLDGHPLSDICRLPQLMASRDHGVVYLMQAVSGLLVGAVIRHSDNILKGFATSVSLVASAVICEPANRVIVGTCLVAVSVCLYCANNTGAGDEKNGNLKKVKSANI